MAKYHCPNCYIRTGELYELKVASIRYPDEGVYCPCCGWKGSENDAVEQFNELIQKEL